MKEYLHSGIPSKSKYKSLVGSDGFKEMERFSDHFLAENWKFQKQYSGRWVKDPLHQWSRQWEYPFVFSRIDSAIKAREKVRILDAGSGITFFPYYIKSMYPSTDVYCIDTDNTLKNIFERVNANSKVAVGFSASDLRRLPFENGWFDIIYCVSVLEHTEDYPEVIDEFHRVLRPYGRLVITFDLSLDGTRDIAIDGVADLLRTLAGKFIDIENVFLEPAIDISNPDIFTTHSVKDTAPNLLPWRFPKFIYQISAFIQGKRFGSWPPSLTVLCLNVEKRP